MEAYDRYMQVQGVLKRPYVPPPENPIKQKQELKVLLKQQEDSGLSPLQRSASLRSDDSRTSLQDQAKTEKPFLAREIQKVTKEDARERFR